MAAIQGIQGYIRNAGLVRQGKRRMVPSLKSISKALVISGLPLASSLSFPEQIARVSVTR